MVNGRRRAVFITGGMSGIGEELAKRYAAEGCHLAIFDLACKDSVEQAISRCKQSSEQKLEVFEVSVADHLALDEAVNKAVEKIGSPSLAINCAGILRTAAFRELSYEDFKQTIDVNLFGSRNFASSVLAHMHSGDHLALVASLAGIVGTYTHGAYAPSKFGVVGLAEVLRTEFKVEGIDISVICPGEITTPMLDEERRMGSKVAEKMNAFSGLQTVQEACDGIVKGLDRRDFMITPSARAALTRFLAHKLTGLSKWIIDKKLVKALRDNA